MARQDTLLEPTLTLDEALKKFTAYRHELDDAETAASSAVSHRNGLRKDYQKWGKIISDLSENPTLPLRHADVEDDRETKPPPRSIARNGGGATIDPVVENVTAALGNPENAPRSPDDPAECVCGFHVASGLGGSQMHVTRHISFISSIRSGDREALEHAKAALDNAEIEYTTTPPAGAGAKPARKKKASPARKVAKKKR